MITARAVAEVFTTATNVHISAAMDVPPTTELALPAAAVRLSILQVFPTRPTRRSDQKSVQSESCMAIKTPTYPFAALTDVNLTQHPIVNG